ncbi:universal stress protein UspA-like protein [Aphanothece hegewaldii CCALA 016]|uniref:Universal stress protein UspA-like protein n=1 Tax=Aphanothece hegewaldii CCALA 016 TaxID=2107694 RepID=A0A2T1M1L4_9CHRO|nr:universal stress protein [Aphanothece hegewaldii]PSF38602.1 universal stress protein UspA-like protein [Aphanothece hegewaldii CCALA 016]
MFQSCLICTNFSDGLQRLVGYVPELANSGLKQIIFFHSIPAWKQGRIPSQNDHEVIEARQKLESALKNVPDGVDVKIEVRAGSPNAAIVDLVKTYSIDVIFTIPPSFSGVEEQIFGIPTLDLAKVTTAPLMLMRPQLTSVYMNEELSFRCGHLWRYLLIPYDGGGAAQYLIEEIKKYAANRPSNSVQECLLLWVLESKARANDLLKYKQQEAQEKLDSVKQELEALSLKVKTEIRIGDPIIEITKVAVEEDISAIAFAMLHRNPFLSLAAPSLGESILRQIWFPQIFFSPKQ